MKQEKVLAKIEGAFKKQVSKDDRVKNAYLLVHSDRHDIHLGLAEGITGDFSADICQPNYMASVGKIFTAVLVGMLVEHGKLDFQDSIADHLDGELIHGLHLYKGEDHSREIQVKHLLKQTSGLPDCFWPLLDKMMNEPGFKMETREAIEWGKTNLEPTFPPGQDFNYTDTNYYLLGLIIENITDLPFHQALSQYIFKPLKMKHSYMLGFSQPAEDPGCPLAHFSKEGIRLEDYETYAKIDYAGGGVVAPLEDLLKFMRALVQHELVSQATLEIMKSDKSKFGLGIDYGYGIWQIKTVPVLMPAKLNSWGVVGATGAFMFYHPFTDSFVIGNFNETAYQSKGVRFMLLKVLKQLAKLN
ncbi:MAG: serine hydrolase domain-containing protein [Bacillota bacterium]